MSYIIYSDHDSSWPHNISTDIRTMMGSLQSTRINNDKIEYKQEIQ